MVGVDDLLAAVWGEDLPATARNTLQYHVGVLRKTLAAHGAADCLATRDPGYSLTAETDVAEFKAHASAGSRAAAARRARRGRRALRRRPLPVARQRPRRPVAVPVRRAAGGGARELSPDLRRGLGRRRARPRSCGGPDLTAAGPARREPDPRAPVGAAHGRALPHRPAGRRAVVVPHGPPGPRPRARRGTVGAAEPRPPGGAAPGLVAVARAGPASSQPATPWSPTQTGHVRAAWTRRPTLVAHGGQRIVLAGSPVVLGRHADCDLVLQDDQASRRHAQVEPGPDGFVLVDLGSTNGTLLNGRARRPARPARARRPDRRRGALVRSSAPSAARSSDSSEGHRDRLALVERPVIGDPSPAVAG